MKPPAIGTSAPAQRPSPSQSTDDSVRLVNAHYAGVCTVTPTGTETPQDILTYLNTPNTTGKTYCNFTSIRGGWKLLGAEKPAETGMGSALAPKPRAKD